MKCNNHISSNIIKNYKILQQFLVFTYTVRRAFSRTILYFNFIDVFIS